MNLFGKYYSWVSVVAVIAIILVIAYYIGTRTGKGKAGAANDEALKKELNQGTLSFEQSQYVAMADRLSTSMSGFTDDEDAVFSVISKLRTKSDVLNLIKSFGTRRPSFSIGTASLNEWFYLRLDESEIAKINEILSRNSIDYQF